MCLTFLQDKTPTKSILSQKDTKYFVSFIIMAWIATEN